MNEYHAEYYRRNRERIKARIAKYRAENPEKVKAAVERCFADPEKVAKYKAKRAEWYKTYAPIARERTKQWAKAHPEKAKADSNARKALYRSAKHTRKPKWLTKDDLWMIKEAYQLAELRSRVTGISWHVDHIIPLRGKNVSGLHVPINLQVITASENHRKLNRYA